MNQAGGPLEGLRVVEFGGLGPAPQGAMLLADLGAEVVRVDRPGTADHRNLDGRGKGSIILDLKDESDNGIAKELCAAADVLIESFRPGVMERLGLAPEAMLELNPKLVYARMTGWGQDGPWSQLPGHEITYLAITGLLAATGEPGRAPQLSANHLGDMGGGANSLVIGILAALWEREKSGRGQVIDASVVDGASTLAVGTWGGLAAGWWNEPRSSNLWDGGAPFYRAYRTSDSKWFAVGALEETFFEDLVQRLQLPYWSGRQHIRGEWPAMAEDFAHRFAERTRSEWEEILVAPTTCAAPVLEWSEVTSNAQMSDRAVLIDVNGVVQPAPSPRFSRTPAATPTQPRAVGDSNDIPARWGIRASGKWMPTIGGLTTETRPR